MTEINHQQFTVEQQPIEYAGFLTRFCAHIVDAVLIALLIGVYAATYYGDFNFFDDQPFWNTSRLFIGDALPFILTIMFWVYKAATPGKMLVNAKILDAKTGQFPGKVQSVIRYIGYFISAIPLGLGFFWALFDDKNRTWHDMLSGTIVISSNN